MTDDEPSEGVGLEDGVDRWKIGVAVLVAIIAFLVVASALWAGPSDDEMTFTVQNEASENVRYNLTIGYWSECKGNAVDGYTCSYGWADARVGILDSDDVKTFSYIVSPANGTWNTSIRFKLERPDAEEKFDRIGWAINQETTFKVTDFGVDCNCRWADE